MVGASEARQGVALSSLLRMARADLGEVLSAVPLDDSAAVADAIYTHVPLIADRYGLAAGALAADWYEEMREAAEVRGTFAPILGELPGQGRWGALANWAASKDDIEALVAGGLQRTILDVYRQTVMRSAISDPRADGWARFAGGGDGSCGFCMMLISRGAVYSKSTARFGSHDNCNCMAGPVWRGRFGARKVDAYRKSARRREDAFGRAIGSTKADQERARAWIKANT